MPRIYKGKTESCSPDMLQAAISMVQNNGAIKHSAAKSYGISRDILRHWIIKKQIKDETGRMLVLINQE